MRNAWLWKLWFLINQNLNIVFHVLGDFQHGYDKVFIVMMTKKTATNGALPIWFPSRCDFVYCCYISIKCIDCHFSVLQIRILQILIIIKNSRGQGPTIILCSPIQLKIHIQTNFGFSLINGIILVKLRYSRNFKLGHSNK